VIDAAAIIVLIVGLPTLPPGTEDLGGN